MAPQHLSFSLLKNKMQIPRILELYGHLEAEAESFNVGEGRRKGGTASQ